MPAKIPFSYQSFCDALSGAIEKEGENGAIIVDKKEIKEEKARPYEEIRSEALEIWTKLVEKDEENAARILKKVEMIFGRKMKLSEITEDQSELYEAVVEEMKTLL